MRKLASIQKVSDLRPIVGADKILCAKVLGWELVVKKEDFKIDDLCVFVEIDSILPDRPEFEFLKPRGMRVRTVKLRGQVSQGICFPLLILPSSYEPKLDDDVTDLLGIKKYEPAIPAQLAGEAKGVFPSFIPKTDETRVQVLQPLLDKYVGTRCYVTEKLDGSSGTFFFNRGEFGICSRNLQFKLDKQQSWWLKLLIKLGIKKEPEKLSNTFIRLAESLNLEEKLRKLGLNIALQGEVIGEGIQGNKYGIKGQQVYFFNVFDIDKQEYYSCSRFLALMRELETNPVPFDRFTTLKADIPALIKLATAPSTLNDKVPREGVVVRPLIETKDEKFGRVSFKVINPEFLLKYDE